MNKGYLLTNQPSEVRRYCSVLDLKENHQLIEEYKYYHDQGIWSEILEELGTLGIYDMEIYLAGNRLVMIMEVPADFDYENKMAQLATANRQQEWEELMWKYQQKLPWIDDNTKWVGMERIFSLEKSLNHEF